MLITVSENIQWNIYLDWDEDCFDKFSDALFMLFSIYTIVKPHYTDTRYNNTISYTPQPLYNTIVGVHSINRVS